jgi:hypothetical protein
LLKQAGDFFAAQIDQRTDCIIADRGQMRGGAGRHATCDRAAVKHDDRPTGQDQLIGDRQPSDAGAHDDGIASTRALKLWRLRIDSDIHP